MKSPTSIKYLSDILNAPANITEADLQTAASIAAAYPYFVPVRYIQAVSHHRQQPLSQELLAGMQPYMGNWMMFCDFLNGVPVPREQADDKQQKNKKSPGQVIQNMKQAATPAPAARQQPEPAATTGNALPVPAAVEAVIAPAAEIVPEAKELVPPVPDNIVAAIPEQPAALPPVPENVTISAQQPIILPVVVAETVAAQQPAENQQPVQPATPQPEAVEEEYDELLEPAAPIERRDEVTSYEVAEIENKEETSPVAEPVVSRIPAPDTDDLITPLFASDYFLQQGVKVSNDMPDQISDLKAVHEKTEEDKSLMVMMSFTEWLKHFKHTSEKEKAESEDQRALKTMWQREKMAAAIEEETEEIPEEVFEMAVNSITREDGLVSESLAEIYIKQKKYEKAIEMYRKLSLRNPQKNAYFARKIEEVLKEKLS